MITRKWVVDAIAATVVWATIVALAPDPPEDLGRVLKVITLGSCLAALVSVGGTLLLERRLPSLRPVRKAREPLDRRSWVVGGGAGLVVLVALLAILGPDRSFGALTSGIFVAFLTESLVRRPLAAHRDPAAQ